MKVTWHKGNRCANFDDKDKELVAKLVKKGYGPKKTETPKPSTPKPSVFVEETKKGKGEK